MIEKIAHIADYHIHNLKWHQRYREANKYIYKKLKELKPDRILIAGDLFENYIQITNEAKTLAGQFLNNLSKIAPVIIVPGNHDIRKKDLKRKNSVKTVIDLIDNKDVTYYGKSGFYTDDNVVWVNHSHLEKDINPWDEPHNKDKSKTYIDIWHDPINGCISQTGFEMTSKFYRNVSDFKGDYGLFGDIHKFQYLNANKTIAYPSSTFQQDMGEDVDDHGFMLWDITNGSSELHIVPDEYKLITFRTYLDYDYDNIDFKHKLANEKCEFRVIWKDYSSNVNNENENKIKNFISKWNDNIRFEKERVYTNVASSQKLTEAIDVNNQQVQQEIFKEYLKANKYNDVFIEEILKIDNIVEERLELTKKSTNIEWSIEKLWVDNFKSYKNFELDWSNVEGIIQLNGENQQGKTTILDAITYITHGTTLSTNKLGGAQREKYGDNRYINNKRNDDFCEGGMVIDVNGEKYTLLRRTDRKWNKDKSSITSVSTNIDYYEGTEIRDDKKLRGERKTDTQNKLDAIIGDFEDFIRLTLTNSENLNHLISLDRATFIDSVIRDAGYDIFEKKLKEFKEYKKEQNDKRIDINLNDAEDEVNGLKDLLKTHKIDHDEVKVEIKDIDDEMKITNKNRDSEIKKLYKIDSDIAAINIKSANEKIEEYKDAINTNLSRQKNNTDGLKGLKKEYDKDGLESFLKVIKTIDDDILNLKLKISQEDTKIEKERGQITRVKDKVRQLKQKEIDSFSIKSLAIDDEINRTKLILRDAINEETRTLKDNKKDIEFEVKTLSTELKNIKEKGLSKKEQIIELENADECPTCGASQEYQKNITDKIDKLNKDVTELLETGKSTKSKLFKEKEKIKEFDNLLDKLNNYDYTENILKVKNEVDEEINELKNKQESIKNVCGEIKDNIFINVPVLETNIKKGLKIKKTSEVNINTIENNVKSVKQDIKRMGEEKSDNQDKVYVIEKDREQVRTYDTLSQENKELSLKIENIKLTIENAKVKIDKYYDQLKYIEENIDINSKIEDFDDILLSNNSDKDDCNDRLSEIMKEAAVTKETIKDIQNNIKKYQTQIKRDELLKEYQKCVHRDGIPTFLLQKSKDLINVELSDMLTNVDFNVFFDDHLNLKMYMKNSKHAIQNLLESSGKERTFGAVALKMALRTINIKSRPNIFLMDEVMLKLKGKSVEEFNNMLEDMKKRIDKIIIIEHVHDVPFDVLIEIEKDKNGVSSLNVV